MLGSGLVSEVMAQLPGISIKLAQMIVMVRDYLRDHPELNRLIRGRESSDRQIAWAIVRAIDVYNSSPPFIGQISLNNFPSMDLLLRFTVADLLEQVALLSARNHLNFSDEGLSFSVSDKHSMLMQWANMYRQSAEMRLGKIKRSLNAEMAMTGGGAASEYFVINGTYLPGY